MRCPFCQGKKSSIVETRHVKSENGDDYIRRRRQCSSAKCGERWTTYESFEMADPELCVRANEARDLIEKATKLLAKTA